MNTDIENELHRVSKKVATFIPKNGCGPTESSCQQ